MLVDNSDHYGTPMAVLRAELCAVSFFLKPESLALVLQIDATWLAIDFQRAQPTRGGTVWQLQMPANRDQLIS